jgi:uncharacterized membrane protein
MGFALDPSIDRASAGGEQPERRSHPVTRRRRWSGRRVAFVMLVSAVAGSVVFTWLPYITLDPSTGRLSPQQHPWFFPVLVVHLLGSTVAVITCVIQVWTRVRIRHPRVHRYSGRLYVFAGIYPAAVSALVLSVFWPYTPLTVFSDVLTSMLWLILTTYGFILARRGWTADHRRWMLRSFALTVSVVLNIALGYPLGLVLKPLLHSHFAGSEAVLEQVWSGLDVWLGWVLAFLAVEWWLEREELRRTARRHGHLPQAEPQEPAVRGA